MYVGETLAAGLKIDWSRMPTYNTIMSLAVGAGLLLIVMLGWQLVDGRGAGGGTDGYALAFGVLGLILTVTGAHMTLTWPLAVYFPFDNIIFGETGFGFGVLLLAAAWYLWKRGHTLADTPDPVGRVAAVSGPVSVFVFGLGLALIAIAAAGIRYELFAAPPEEPISGEFADHPLIECIFMSGLIALVGVGALLFPFALRLRHRVVLILTGVVWAVSGAAFLLFGALNFFTHIGLIVNTM